jgi:Protein of unknown function (DUF3592)
LDIAAAAAVAPIVADFITLCAIVIVAPSSILQRLYIQRFWIPALGTVTRLEGGISTMADAPAVWVWTPVIEYQADDQQFTSQFSYWQRFNAKSKYAVGDRVEILYNPRKPSSFVLDSWDSWMNYIAVTIFIGFSIASAVALRNHNR